MGAKFGYAAACVAALWCASAHAQAVPAKMAEPVKKATSALPAPKVLQPKLIVAISIDQLSSDLFAEYRQKFTGGFKRLLEGAVFPSGYQSHAATETCPGHSTILTGVRPARNGIVANDWSNPASTRTGKDGKPDYGVYCAEDETVAGSNSSDYTVSAVHLKSPTLGDRLKAKDKASRVVAVAGKDRAAVMMGGHAIDQAWWWAKDGFVSFSRSDVKVPLGLAAINARAKAMIAKPTLPALPAQCQGHSMAVPIEGGKTVGTLSRRKEGDARGFRASSDFDQVTLDLARAITTELKLGKGSATDVLAIGLSATDYLGHSFGTNGAETCTHMFALDAMLGRFLGSLDRMGTPYIVVLTADHGGHDLPERNKQMAVTDAERADVALMPNAVGALIAKGLDLKGNPLIGNAPFGDIYVSNDVPADKRATVRDAAMKIYREHRQVEAVIDGEFLSQLPMPTGEPSAWTIVDRARASYHAGRSGDFIVLLKPHITPIPSSGFGYVATHGSPWDYDRRVPIVFWQAGRPGFEQPNGVETVDIMPTLGALIGLSIPKGEIDGRCLDLDRGASSTCPAAN